MNLNINIDDEKRLSYLLSGTFRVLPPSYIKLRSYLGTHCAKIASENDLSIFNSKKVCPFCFSPWSSDTCSFKLLPSKKVKKRLKRTVVNGGQTETAQGLENLLVVKCEVCTKRSSFPLTKKRAVKETIQPEEKIVVKKKKRKKDKTCGLRIPKEYLAQSKKKKGPAKGVGKGITNPAKAQTKTPVNSPIPKNKPPPVPKSKETTLKPLSHPQHQKNARRRQQNLIKLKEAVKGSKEVTKKSLKDFLNLL